MKYIVDTTIVITQTIEAGCERDAVSEAEYALEYGKHASTPLHIFLDGVNMESSAVEDA